MGTILDVLPPPTIPSPFHKPHMTTEQSPLLPSDVAPPQCNGIEVASTTLDRDGGDVYKRFSKAQKRAIVALVSWAGLVPLFVSGSFIPATPQVAREFNSTGSIANLAISLSIFAVALGTFVWASYSGFYGRRPIYLLSLPILSIGSLGVASAPNIIALMVWRFVQAFGAGSGLSVGAGVIGDIYCLEERGSAMGVFFTACLLGPALAPLAGGLATHYSSWRVMQFAIFVAATVSWLLMALFMPETSQPRARGLDKLLESEGLPGGAEWRWVWLNPFKSIAWFRSPNLLFVCIACTFVLLTGYTLLVPLPYTIGFQYGIKNEVIIGAMCLPAGLGNTIGAPLAGRISDCIVQRWKVKRGGVWVPEDRLRGTTIAALIYVPVSVLLSGAITQYRHGPLGIVLNLLCLFVNGLGVDLVVCPSAAYFVDIMHARSAETTAADNGLRSAFIALATSAILPLINHIGVFATNAIAAGLAWIGFVLLWVTIRYGDRMRAWIDPGFATPAET